MVPISCPACSPQICPISGDWSSRLWERNCIFLARPRAKNMGRGVSSGGGQSSLGYLFSNGEAPKPAPSNMADNDAVPAQKLPVTSSFIDISKQIPAGLGANNTNNYFRANGQNTDNFITDRPSTKVQFAPGGRSSLGYLFGGGTN